MTTILRVIAKPKITEWAARKSAEYAVSHWKELESLPVTEKVDRIRYAHEKLRDDAASLGDAVHQVVDAWNRGEAQGTTKSTDAYLNSFVSFLFEKQPRFLYSEVTLWSYRHEYAGTADWLAEIDGEIWLGDNKTSKRGVYAETALQLSALAGADVILCEDGSEAEIPALEKLAALHLRPRSWRLLPVNDRERHFATFLSARDILDWTQNAAPYALGEAA